MRVYQRGCNVQCNSPLCMVLELKGEEDGCGFSIPQLPGSQQSPQWDERWVDGSSGPTTCLT